MAGAYECSRPITRIQYAFAVYGCDSEFEGSLRYGALWMVGRHRNQGMSKE